MNQKIVLEKIVSEISEKTGQNIYLLAVENLGGGCINHASKLITSAGNFFLKWNPDCASDIFLREAEGLQELKKAAAGNLIVPEVIVANAEGSSLRYLVLEYLESGYQGNLAEEQLGRGLALIHKHSFEKFGFYTDNFCGATIQHNVWKCNWPQFFAQNRLQFLMDLIRKTRNLGSSEIKTFEKLVQKIPDLLPGNSIPALIHGDLWSGNYLHTNKGPVLIDPAASYSDREMEFGIITMFGGFSDRFFAAYNETYPLPNDWKSRNRLYQLYHVLNHYYLFGGAYISQAFQIAKSYL